MQKGDIIGVNHAVFINVTVGQERGRQEVGVVDVTDEAREIEHGWPRVGIKITEELGVRRDGGKESRHQQHREEARDADERHGARVRYFTHGMDLVWLRERRTGFTGESQFL